MRWPDEELPWCLVVGFDLAGDVRSSHLVRPVVERSLGKPVPLAADEPLFGQHAAEFVDKLVGDEAQLFADSLVGTDFCKCRKRTWLIHIMSENENDRQEESSGRMASPARARRHSNSGSAATA